LELDRINVLLSDPDGRMLQAIASLGAEEPLEVIRVPIGPEGGGVAQAYLTKEAIVWHGRGPVPETLRLKPPFDRIATLRSRVFANVPLVVQGRAIGVLGVDRKHSRRPFEPAALALLQLFAGQAALAIEHGRLYEAQRTAAIQLEATVEARTRDLQVANVRLEEASRVAEEASRHKSAFLANMSHELRTPLNAILGFSELLAQQTYGPLTQKQARYVDNVHTSGQYLLALINDLLDLSKIEAGKLELQTQAFDLREALEAALHVFRHQAEAKQQTLMLQVADDVSIITADPLRIKQVLYNLLSNAVKFTPDGGRVTVTARRVPSSEFHVPSSEPGTWDLEPGTARVTEYVEIAVADTGIGIKAEDLPKLFQPFTQLEHTLTKQAQGTGLGLALTRRLVELHGGTIWAESAGEGRGSTFTIRLPLRPPAS
jgi:signal transduction histidine kinase